MTLMNLWKSMPSATKLICLHTYGIFIMQKKEIISEVLFFERQMSWSNIYRSLQNCYSSLPKKVNGIWTIRSIPCQKEGTI